MRRQRKPTQEELQQLEQAQTEARRLYEAVPQEIRERSNEWKCKGHSVFAVRILDKWYVVRGISLGEAQLFTEMVRPDLYSDPGYSSGMPEAQDYLISSALLYPRDLSLSDMLQGEVSALCKCIWYCAGFADLESFFGSIDEARARIQSNPDDTVMLFVCKAFGMKPREVMELDMRTLSRHIAMAEVILGTELPLQIKGGLRPTPEHYDIANQLATGKVMKGNVPQPHGVPPGVRPRAQPHTEPQQHQGIAARSMPSVKPEMGGSKGFINTEAENAELRKFING